MKTKRFLALLLSVLMIASCFTLTTYATNTGKIKNVIYMIPDGGGMEPFWLADAVKEAGGMNTTLYPYVTPQTVNKMYLRDYLVSGMTTYAANADITDSAAAGTAMAIGYKTNLYQIGLDPSYNPKANILEAAQLSGRKTGLVTRYEFAHATPAAFSAHAANRSDYRMMAEQIVNQGIDVVLSPGLYNNVCQFEDGLDTITNMGYTLINSKYDLANIQKGDKVWSYMPTYSFDYQNTAASPTLAEMTEAAIRALECDDGFFMMVEGSSVDTGGHDNNALEMVGNFIAFDEACKIAIEYAKGRDDTVVMVAPDHDTGGMNVLNESAAVASLQSGSNPSSSALTWTSKEHTARNGGVFLYVPDGISYPTGTSSNPGVASNFDNYTIDNDDLAHYLADCMGFDLDDATDELFVNISSLGTYTKTYDSEAQTSNYTGTFTFNNSDCTIEANQSYATIDGERVSLDGQVAFYEYNTGKFYAPQKLLNYLDGTEVPDEDATTGGGTAGNNSLITQTSITSMGTAATFWGNVATYENVTNNDNTSITMQPGGWATFNVPVVNSGIYYLQVKSSGGDTTLEMVVNDEYYAEMPVYSTEQNYYLNNGSYEFLYLPAGKAAVTFTNIGNEACTVSDIRLVASQNAVNAGVTPTMASVKRRAVWLGASQNQVDHYNGYTSGSAYSTTLAPGAYAKINVSGLPYSGIYGLQLKLSSVSGTANIRAFSGDGYYADYTISEAGVWTNRMSPARDCPIYFKSGSNTLYIKNTGSTNFTFQEFDLARMDAGDSFDFKYLLKATTTLPDGTTVSPSLAPAKAEWAYAAQNQDGYFNGYTSDGEPQVTLAPGEFTTITVTDIPYTGVYAFQLRLPTISGTANVRVTTDKGYYGDYAITEANTWTNRMTPGQDQPIYFTQGTNTFYIENTGSTSFYLKDYDIGRLDAGNSMDFAYLLKQTDSIPGDGTDTPTSTATPTPTATPSSPTTGVPEIPAKTIDSWNGVYSNVGTDYGTAYYPGGSKVYVGSEVSGYATDYYKQQGASVTYTFDAPYTGVYVFQTYAGDYSTGTATFEVSTEEGYYWEINRTNTGWSSGDKTDALIFLREGTNEITVTWTGAGYAGLYEIDIGLFNESGDYSSMAFYNLIPYRGEVVDPNPTATPTPTSTPTPTPTPTYVPGDADEWTGRFSDVESHNNGYVGEIYTMTTFTKTNGTSSVAGVDYKASSSSPFGSNGAFTMVVGDWGQYEVTVPYTGVYAMQLQTAWIGGTGTTRLMVSADTGYYSIHDLAHATWTSGSYADQPIYLEAGKNIITIKVLDGNNCILSGIDFGRLDKNGETASLDYLPLVNVKEDKFTNLKIDGATATATVTYQKFYDDAAATLYLGEYDPTSGKLLGINLLNIDTETANQEVNAFDTYSVSISGATGNLKAMLLDETLKPVITEAKLQEATRLTGKKVSILGDSISTYIGYSNNTAYNSTIGSNAVYYNGYYQGFKDVNETWWKQMIDQTGMELLVNNSYSGDKVCTNGISRALELDNNENVNPDVIVVYLGVNDIIGGCTTSKFTTNYNTMISGMRNKYPDAEIYLMTFPYFQSSSVGSYCDIVAQTAATYNCEFVDLYRNSGITSANVANYMVDGFLHPNYAGMDKITDCLVDVMLGE